MVVILFLIIAGIVLLVVGAIVKGVFYLLIIGAIVLVLGLIYGALRSRRGGPRGRVRR